MIMRARREAGEVEKGRRAVWRRRRVEEEEVGRREVRNDILGCELW